MGGNALKSTYTRRYQREEFLDILFEVRTRLINRDIISEVPAWYRNKDSFGDLDVLIKSSTVKGDIIDIINELFSPNEIYNNSNVKSFDYKEFQIDFILVPDDKWKTSICYFSYNDLGNFIGRIAYQMGFRYGDYGLKLVYIHENGGEKFRKIISDKPSQIYSFLGFDYETYLKGFNDVEDIFKFIVNSRYFNKSIYNYENLDHQNRTRNKKRKNYEKFLNYVSDLEDNNNYQFRDRQFYINKAEKHFHIKINDEINNWNAEVELNKKAAKKFNGNLISEKTGLTGKSLGEGIKKFKEVAYFLLKIRGEEPYTKKLMLNQWILDKDIDELIEIFCRVNNINNRDCSKNNKNSHDNLLNYQK